jgi:hypothetical protein
MEKQTARSASVVVKADVRSSWGRVWLTDWVWSHMESDRKLIRKSYLSVLPVHNLRSANVRFELGSPPIGSLLGPRGRAANVTAAVAQERSWRARGILEVSIGQGSRAAFHDMKLNAGSQRVGR